VGHPGMDDDPKPDRSVYGDDIVVDIFVVLVCLPWLIPLFFGAGWLIYHVGRLTWRHVVYPVWHFLATSWLEILLSLGVTAALMALAWVLVRLLTPAARRSRIRAHYWNLGAAEQRRFRTTRRRLRRRIGKCDEGYSKIKRTIRCAAHRGRTIFVGPV
jgi:hypothetical protein